jgi:hypothetical protein
MASDVTFEAELAGVPKYGLAVALDMLVEPDAGVGLGHYRCERGLADLKRIDCIFFTDTCIADAVLSYRPRSRTSVWSSVDFP